MSSTVADQVACILESMLSIDVRRPLAVDLFSGAGGLSLGLEQAGFDLAAAVEYDPIHAAAHHFNFPYAATFCSDVSKITGREIREGSEIGDREIALIAGGPPCQGISMIGKRAIDDPRNVLLREFMRLVVELQPRYFMMENVAGLTVGNHRQLLDEVVKEAIKGGYQVTLPYKVLQAADFGTPQSRRRLILMGSRSDVPLPNYPDPTHTPRTIKGAVLPSAAANPLSPSVWDALKDLPDADSYEALLHDDHVVAEFGEPSEYAASLRGLVRSIDDFSRPRAFDPQLLTSSMRTVHTAKSIRRFQETVPGTTESISRFLRLHPEGISNTLRAGTAADRGAHTAPRPIHPKHPRVITVREAARLHGYPDWFRFHVTKWNGFRQIGNSVPMHLGRAVGKAILAADGITPIHGAQIAERSDTSLLYFTAREAERHFGILEPVIPSRLRKVV